MFLGPHASAGSAERKFLNQFIIYSPFVLSWSKDSERVFSTPCQEKCNEKIYRSLYLAST